MAPRNGYVPDGQLVDVQGQRLARATAAAFNAANAASGGILKIAAVAGAYRDYKTQGDMKAGRPSYQYWNLDPASSVSLANPGASSHGFGDRVDIATGAGRTWAINNLGNYGFVREFGANDPGHFKFLHETWDGDTSLPASGLGSDDVKFLANYLNSRAASLGLPTTTANLDGKQGPNYWRLVQKAGSVDGLYPQPAYKIDGIPGGKTLSLEVHFLGVAKGGTPVPTPPAAAETDKQMVQRIARYLNARPLGIDSTAAQDGIRGKAYWTEIQTAGRQDGLYPKGTYVIDGVPGAKSYELERHYSGIA